MRVLEGLEVGGRMEEGSGGREVGGDWREWREGGGREGGRGVGGEWREGGGRDMFKAMCSMSNLQVKLSIG